MVTYVMCFVLAVCLALAIPVLGALTFVAGAAVAAKAGRA